jgi:hypothetical protein
VKWTEDRREHFLTTTQQRDQWWEVEVACEPGGKVLALRAKCTHEAGGARGADAQRRVQSGADVHRLPQGDCPSAAADRAGDRCAEAGCGEGEVSYKPVHRVELFTSLAFSPTGDKRRLS